MYVALQPLKSNSEAHCKTAFQVLCTLCVEWVEYFSQKLLTHECESLQAEMLILLTMINDDLFSLKRFPSPGRRLLLCTHGCFYSYVCRDAPVPFGCSLPTVTFAFGSDLELPLYCPSCCRLRCLCKSFLLAFKDPSLPKSNSHVGLCFMAPGT